MSKSMRFSLVTIVFLVVSMVGSKASIAAPPQVDALRVHVLDCGKFLGIETDELLAAVPDPPERIDLVHRCFLVEHPKGRLLWDAGLPRSVGYQLMRIGLLVTSLGKSSVELGDPLPDQLEALGLTVADIDYVAFSHSHWDHTGAGNLFTQSTWIIQKEELDWAFADEGVERPHVDEDLYSDLESSQKLVLEGDHDLFGDGSVVMLTAPGHTPGHQCLFLELPKTGPVVLSGDLYHNVLNLEHHAPPAFNTDADQTRESMKRIDAFVSERGADLWIQHDPTSGPQAPALRE